jgi:hypothetical protein
MHSLLWLNTVLAAVLLGNWVACAGQLFLCFFRYDQSLELCYARMWPGLHDSSLSGTWRQISWIHQILMSKSGNDYQSQWGHYLLNGLNCPDWSWHESIYLQSSIVQYLNVEIVQLCFLTKQVIYDNWKIWWNPIMVIPVLSEVKHTLFGEG